MASNEPIGEAVNPETDGSDEVQEKLESNESVSSHPLKHLLSLDWDDSNDISVTTKSVGDENKPLKPKKKVRFSDTVEQNYLDINDLESNLSDSESENDNSSQYEEFSDDNFEDDDSDGELDDDKEPSELELEIDEKFSMSKDFPNGEVNDLIKSPQSEDLPNSEVNDLIKSPQPEDLPNDEVNDLIKLPSSVNDQAKNLDELDAAVEKQLLQFNFQNRDELLKILSDDTENKSDHVSSDILGNVEKETDSLRTVSSEKKKYDNRILQKQSDKINELLKNTDLTSSNALQIKQAVWEAWSTVKKWEYITMIRERKKSSEKSALKTESTPRKAVTIPQPQVSKKRMNQKKKKANSTFNTQNQQPKKPREKSQADIEESKMAFKAWKEQKEEILKENAMKRHEEKRQKRMSLLMEEEIKKERAESAFIEWKMKKIHITKKENEKKDWLLQKEREANEQKLQRDKEAQEIFHKWLERKYFHSENNSMSSNERPPWLPPGHS